MAFFTRPCHASNFFTSRTFNSWKANTRCILYLSKNYKKNLIHTDSKHGNVNGHNTMAENKYVDTNGMKLQTNGTGSYDGKKRNEEIGKKEVKKIQTELTETVGGRIRNITVVNGVLKMEWERKGKSRSRWTSFLAGLFLPIGYPNTVHSSYLQHHMWVLSESFFSAIFFVLANEAMLSALGVGAAAGAGAVAIQWILKDGLGEVGKLVITNFFCKYFDSKPKTWKFIGEFLQIVGYGFMILCAFAPSSYFLLLASIGNALRVASFMIWGSSSAYLFRNFALYQNVGDLMSKFESQSVVANLAGYAVGIAMISLSHSPMFLMQIFLALSPLSLISTVKSLQAVSFEVLNEVKIMKLVTHWVKSHILTPSELQKDERFFGEWVFESHRILTCVSMSICENAEILTETIEIFSDAAYLLLLKSDGHIGIVLHEDAKERDILRALHHSVILTFKIRQETSTESISESLVNIGNPAFLKIVKDNYGVVRSDFQKFVTDLDQVGWSSENIAWVDHGIRANWRRVTNEIEAPDNNIKPL